MTDATPTTETPVSDAAPLVQALADKQTTTGKDEATKKVAFKSNPYSWKDEGATVTCELSGPLVLYVHEIDGLYQCTLDESLDPRVYGLLENGGQKDRVQAVKYAQRNCAYRAATNALKPRGAAAASMKTENVQLKAAVDVADAKIRVLTAIMTGSEPVAEDAAAVGEAFVTEVREKFAAATAPAPRSRR